MLFLLVKVTEPGQSPQMSLKDFPCRWKLASGTEGTSLSFSPEHLSSGIVVLPT